MFEAVCEIPLRQPESEENTKPNSGVLLKELPSVELKTPTRRSSKGKVTNQPLLQGRQQEKRRKKRPRCPVYRLLAERRIGCHTWLSTSGHLEPFPLPCQRREPRREGNRAPAG